MKTRRMLRSRTGVGLLMLGIACMISVHASEVYAQQLREIAVPGMRGIASVGYRGNQLTIEYNPRTCARMGPDLCAFFRAHEYGHIALRHLERGTPVRQAEYEADQWAARHVTQASRQAAIRYFNAGRGGSLRHGSAASRAQRVAAAGYAAPRRVAYRPDGMGVARRYSAVIQRPFDTGNRRPLLRWFRR